MKNALTPHQVFATSLLADLDSATARNLPRREVLVAWLVDFIDRSARRGFSLGATEVADLTAVHDYLVVSQVASTPRQALI